ncbi:hypothetical protein [Haloechinothrix salitolerans]|uniref:Uncharacterized protein n=1 Tax=Haloechinothrix salitolerans TaxID=926830 RepID=A0ABW2C760_9PSEU
MSSDTVRTVVVVCVIALTIMIGLYLFTSTPLCEVFATERTEWIDHDTKYVYADEYSKRLGKCVEGRTLIEDGAP